MKPSLILLCAGRGKRMESLTDENPKALVAVHNKPIVEHTSDAFLKAWPSASLTLLSGYRSEKLSSWIEQKSYNADILFNKDWNTYGPIISCCTALQGAGDASQIFLGNGDTLFSDEIFNTIKDSDIADGMYLVGSRVHDQSEDDMLISIENGKVLNAEKRKTGNIMSDFESSGLLLAAGSHYVSILKQVFDDMSEALKADSSCDGPWHGVVQKLVAAGHTISFINVPEKSWWEFDTQQCIAKAEAATK